MPPWHDNLCHYYDFTCLRLPLCKNRTFKEQTCSRLTFSCGHLQYYGPYGYVQPNSQDVPKPNVNVDIVPGCNILRNQFAVANYSGPLPCTLPGQATSAAAGGRRLMQAAFQNTNTSVPCEVRCLSLPVLLLHASVLNVPAFPGNEAGVYRAHLIQARDMAKMSRC